MTTRSGYGVSSYGVGPYGGVQVYGSGGIFDIFCFEYGSMYSILLDPNVEALGDGGHFHPNLSTLDMDVLAGEGEPVDDARIVVTANVPSTYTVEWVVNFTSLPNDFTGLVHQHVYAGVSDAAGALVGFLFSKVGVAYTGSVSFPGGDLSLDCTLQVLPGSASYITEGEYYVVRAAADFDLGIVYFYMTKLADIPTTGHKLRAVLPVIPFTSAANPPTDASIISVRGTLIDGVTACWSSWCLGSSLIIPNLIPVSDAGHDQAVRNCSVILLDGSGSFDPEGADLAYYWRLVEGPNTSAFVVEESDGAAYPLSPSTGYTDKFHSTELGLVDGSDPIIVGTDGDVLLVQGDAYTLVGKGVDGNGFYVQVGEQIIPESGTSEPFKVLRQRGVKDPDTVHPTFFPDKPGFYKFDLVVNDGALYSTESTVLVNVMESVLPRGCTPDLTFLFEYLSDFWGLVEDKERINTFWSSLAQVAATELFTLWQLEYSKSLRDIQRYFNRRWLHYDLLLPEPIPELTKMRVMYGGVRSAWLATAGEALSGSVVVIESPLLAAPVTLTIVSANPVTPTQLATELQAGLQSFVGSGFTAHVVENRATLTEAVRIDAAQPFSIGVGTTLPFTVGTENRHPSGYSGAGVGYKGYKADRSLEGLGIVEDDLLVVSGVAYRIASVQNIDTDDFPYQRLILKEQLPEDVSAEWAIGSWVSSEFLDFYNGLVTVNDYADLEVSDVVVDASSARTRALVECRVLGVNGDLPSRVAVDAWDVSHYAAQPSLYTTYLARVLRRSYAPVDELVVDIPTMQRLIVMEDDEATLRRNVDYFIEPVRGQNAVRFVAGVGVYSDVWEGERPPNRLWAEYTYLSNNPLIEANFGYVIGLGLDQLADLPENTDYLSAVRGLWHSFYNGPTLANLRIGAQILLGLPFAEEDSYIEEIRIDFSPKYGRLLLKDKLNPQIIRSYSFPNILLLEMNPATRARYAVGDLVQQFAPLVEGVEVLDYVKDPLWFQGYLNQGVFYEVEKYHRFAVTVDVAAFSINTLMFVRNFVLQAKPAYTYPMFVVRYKVGETEVSTTDQKSAAVRLSVYDSPNAALIGSSFFLDEPRCAVGGIRNQLDSDQDPNNDPPAYGYPDAVVWGLDKNYFLIPGEEHLVVASETWGSSFTPTLDSIWVLDTFACTEMYYEDSPVSGVPAGPAGLPLTPTGDVTFPFPSGGYVVRARFIAFGDPGPDPADYEVVVSIAGVDSVAYPFTDIVNKEVILSLSLACAYNDVIGIRVRPTSGGSRSPNWSKICAHIYVTDSMWTLDDTFDAGTYCTEHTT